MEARRSGFHLKRRSSGTSAFCSRTRVRPGESFADIHPELMDEYSPDNQVDPYQVYPSSKKYTDWRCRNNPAHQWKTSFYQRHIGSGKCPICNRTRPYAGVNTFSDVYPEYVDLWSPANEKAPNEVFADSTVWYKWRCPECSEEYSAQIQNVVSGKKSCPYCRDRKVLGGVNSFADVYPEVAKQWSAKNAKAARDVLHSIIYV